jgi:alpha-L-fucosidase
MNNCIKQLIVAALLASPTFSLAANNEQQTYVPTQEIIDARQQFADRGFGIFIHWGIYSIFAQGEWYLNREGITAEEYAKAASAFYPANFDAAKWVSAIKNSGAKYITFTTRHHDGFSMFNTAQSDYNIMKATPFKRDILKELADECHKQDVKLHLYYSHIDWTRPDYPSGRTGLTTGRDITKRDWKHYYKFMNNQLTELLTNYGEIGAIWFDGWWDHEQDSIPFDWELPEQYALIHKLQPSCLVGNNHHQTPFAGEDIQIFERDLPGENNAGLSGQEISRLPLETCETMNGMWGYKIIDQNYKTVPELIHLLVKAAGMGANLLLNIGPQPNGELPAAALNRLEGIGKWMDKYGETFYATTAGDFEAQEWGTSTRKGNKLYIHIFDNKRAEVQLPLSVKVKKAIAFDSGESLKFKNNKQGGTTLYLPEIAAGTIDYIVELETTSKK